MNFLHLPFRVAILPLEPEKHVKNRSFKYWSYSASVFDEKLQCVQFWIRNFKMCLFVKKINLVRFWILKTYNAVDSDLKSLECFRYWKKVGCQKSRFEPFNSVKTTSFKYIVFLWKAWFCVKKLEVSDFELNFYNVWNFNLNNLQQIRFWTRLFESADFELKILKRVRFSKNFLIVCYFELKNFISSHFIF